jgi:hypothetical protein
MMQPGVRIQIANVWREVEAPQGYIAGESANSGSAKTATNKIREAVENGLFLRLPVQ